MFSKAPFFEISEKLHNGKQGFALTIKKSGRNTFLPGFFISISQYTAQKKAAPSKRDCPFHHLIPITSICARIASTHFSNPSFPLDSGTDHNLSHHSSP
ncbi:MAG: hypothetical protein V8Q87_02750, partial [Blautia wexlerae]